VASLTIIGDGGWLQYIRNNLRLYV
jgi:hypothetical protein